VVSRWDVDPWRRWLIDIVVAVVATCLAVVGSVGEARSNAHNPASLNRYLTAHPPGAWYTLVVLAGVVLVFRRLSPLLVLGVASAAVAAYTGAGYVEGAALVAVYVALYTVATLETRWRAVAAAVASVVVIFVAGGVGGPFGWLGGPNAVAVACAIAALAIGMAVGGRRQYLAVVAERARRAERDREEETRRRVDAERMRIARELHDVVAHSMSMIHIQAGMAAHVLNDRPDQAAEALTAIKSASREGLRELRAILNVLRQADTVDSVGGGHSVPPAPGLQQLGALVDATTQAGLPTTLSMTSSSSAQTLPVSLELAVYRIVQESVTNALRHGAIGARASVRIVAGRRKVLVQVDNTGGPTVPVGAGASGAVMAGEGVGSGGAALGGGGSGGSGITGMRERAAAFGGRVRAGPRDYGGWRVRAVIPIPVESA
jgi:signal transduction histidine kinase